MKSTELRIGDLVHYEYKEMSKDIEVNITVFQELENFTYRNRIKPIPLSEDWLLKFGFDNSLVKDIYLALGYNVIHDEGKYYFRHYGLTKEVEYVHQLQNLYFALTGEELTIKEEIGTTT